MRNAALLLLRVAGLLLLTTVAAAQGVLVVRPRPEDPVLTEAFGRLRAELELQSFEVLVLESPGAPVEPDLLERQAQLRGAFAAVALRRDASGTAAVIWIVDRVTGKATQRKLSIDGSRDGPTLLAIRAVDLLRVSLLELDSTRRPPADVLGVERAAPPAEVIRFARRVHRFQLGVGALALASPPLGAALGVSLSARHRPLPRLSLGLQLGGPALGGEFRPTNGSASIRQEFALAFAAWNLARHSRGDWEWGPRVGAGAAHLVASGSVQPPLVARTSDVWTFIANAGIGAAFFVSEDVSISVDAGGIALVPQPVIAVVDQRSSSLTFQGLVSLELAVGF